MCQSIPSLTIHPRTNPREFFERANAPSPGHKESAKPGPLEHKNRAKALLLPRGNYFKKSNNKKAKHERKIMKNSIEMLICLEILKQ